MNDKALQENIKRHRKAKGMTLQELADAAGASKSHIFAIETGEIKSPSASLVYQIAVALDQTIESLLGVQCASKTEIRVLMRKYEKLTASDRKRLLAIAEILGCQS